MSQRPERFKANQITDDHQMEESDQPPLFDEVETFFCVIIALSLHHQLEITSTQVPAPQRGLSKRKTRTLKARIKQTLAACQTPRLPAPKAKML
jgi:hypothetical protein